LAGLNRRKSLQVAEAFSEPVGAAVTKDMSASFLFTSSSELSENLSIAGWDWSEQDPEQFDDSDSSDEEFQLDLAEDEFEEGF
jgi:hypothetical protein